MVLRSWCSIVMHVVVKIVISTWSVATPTYRMTGTSEVLRWLSDAHIYLFPQIGNLLSVTAVKRMLLLREREMKREDFFAINKLTQYIVNQKQNKDKQKVNWLKFLWIRVEKSAPLTSITPPIMSLNSGKLSI